MSWKLKQKAKRILAREKGAIIKEPGGKISIGLVFPNRYFVAMSHLGFQFLYHLLNRYKNVVCERIFLPEKDDIKEFLRTLSLLFSLESQRPINDFDALAFTLPFEMDFINILTILKMGNIPIYSSERNESHPLIIGGGITTFLNPEPIAPFFDLFLIGDAEELIPEFLLLFENYGKSSRSIFFKEAVRIKGFYVPSMYEPIYDDSGVMKSFLPKDDAPTKIECQKSLKKDKDIPFSPIITPDTEFANMRLIEINRGCPFRCRFCATGYVYFPFRNWSTDKIIDLVEKVELVDHKCGLVGSAICDHPEIETLLDETKEKFFEVSVSSLRADRITKEVAKKLVLGGYKTATLAPEAGTERLRKIIKKDISDDKIIETITILFKEGIFNFKLYFLIGLPAERWEDIEGIIKLIRRIKHALVKEAKDPFRLKGITISVNPFVPKPFTPFQFHPFEDKDSLKEKLSFLKKELRKEKKVNMIHDLPKWAYVQAFLSRGDRRVATVIDMANNLGNNFYKAFKETPLNPDFYVYRQREKDEVFPWDFIDQGIEKSYLWSEYQKALLLGDEIK